MGREPGAGVMRELEGRAEALSGTFNTQGVANTLWAYATMGRKPGAGVMRELEGRAEALAGTFNTQDVAMYLASYKEGHQNGRLTWHAPPNGTHVKQARAASKSSWTPLAPMTQ